MRLRKPGEANSPKPPPVVAKETKQRVSRKRQGQESEPITGIRLGRVLGLASAVIAVLLFVLFLQGEEFDATMKQIIANRFAFFAVAVALVFGLSAGAFGGWRIGRSHFADNRLTDADIRASNPYKQLEAKLERQKADAEKAQKAHQEELEKRGVPGLELQITTLRKEKGVVAEDLGKANAEVKRLGAELSTESAAREKAQRDLQTAEERADKRVKLIVERVTGERDRALERVQELTEANETATTQLAAAIAFTDQLADTIQMVQQLLSESQGAVRSLEDRIASIRRNRQQQANGRIEEVQRQRDAALAKLKPFEVRADLADAEVGRVNEELKRLALQLAARTRELDEARTAMREMTERHNGAEDEWNHARAQLEADFGVLEQARDGLVDELSNLRSQHAVLSERAKEMAFELTLEANTFEARLTERREEGYKAGFAEGEAAGKATAPPPEELETLRDKVRVLQTQLDASFQALKLVPIVRDISGKVPRDLRKHFVDADQYRQDGAGKHALMTARHVAELRIRAHGAQPQDLAKDWEARIKLTTARASLDFFTLVVILCDLVRIAEAKKLTNVNAGFLKDAVVNELNHLLAYFDELRRAFKPSGPDWVHLRDTFVNSGLVDNVGVAFALETVPPDVRDALTAFWTEEYPADDASA